ncbi:hypothetical protein F3Y22_tig00112249pilonHSYRG00344 [Hibiscus syriacus]|uniref:ADP-ribosyl cyclase/cyclic ADP-ribose hydrolase n=1 Tax=Hibiscus syriacus TaxID=106335 RepID=A0A6A2YCI4_HIBSY|nr:hypothetical protein F3Y22_tig00112249pilonHSYRG00344 [Hibiscus syriacus]
MNVFFDEEKLEKGEQFLGQLTQSIEVSNLSIIILSADYASSDVCLTELSQIMDLKRNQGHIVLPIFFHVDPSDVQNISGTFQKSFDAHETKQPPQGGEEKLKQWKLKQQKVKQWKADLAQVGTLKGVHITGDRPETEHIEHIVECAIKKLMKHQVFLSFGEDTRLNFSSHLLKALEDTGINVISDDQTEIEISQAIAASNLSIVVLSKDYAVSESCLAELSCIMARQRTQKHIVVPIFYHVKPDVLKLGGNENLGEVAGLQGWPIEGGYSDRPETEHIKVVVRDVIKKLNRKSRSVSDDLIGIDDQKETILRLIDQEKNRVIGLWGMDGIGKTTLVDAVYNEISLEFESRCFVHNVRRQIEDKGMFSVRNELLSKLLGNETDIDTPSIGCPVTQERLNNIKSIVVLDNVNDPEHINLMGVKYFGEGSKIIITSSDRQVLKNGGADEIYKVKKLNDKDSLQLFSRFAFKQSNSPPAGFPYWNKISRYAGGNPYVLKVLGSKLHTIPEKEWGGEVNKLRKYPQPKILQVSMSSFDDLDEIEKDIFLDISCFFKGEDREEVEEILSCLYEGTVSGINTLLNKCLLDIDSCRRISMHDMLEEMGKDKVRQESKDPEKRSRLWDFKEVNQVLRYNKENTSIEGIKFHSKINKDPLLSCPHGFEHMINLRYINFCADLSMSKNNRVDSISLPDELKYLCWAFYPFKSLSPSFNPKNLVVLKLKFGYMEQLWNEDHQDLVNIRSIDLSYCKKLRTIPNLSGAINLQILDCHECESLIELLCLGRLPSLERFDLYGCKNLRNIPNLLGAINLKSLDCSWYENLVELPYLSHLASLENLNLSHCKNLRKIPDLSGTINLKSLDCTWCESLVELPCLSHLTSLERINLRGCKNLRNIPNLLGAINLKSLDCSRCESLVELPCLSHLTSLESLNLYGCMNLRKISSLSGTTNLNSLDCSWCESLVELPELPNSITKLDLSRSRTEVADSIQHLVRLRKLILSHSRVENVLSNFSKLESLLVLDVDHCESLKTLLEIPRYLWFLDATNCRSLEKVCFTDHNLNSFHSLHDGDDAPHRENVSMLFSNCRSLNQESIENIAANAMLQIHSLAQRWMRKGISREEYKQDCLFCCFPGNEVPESVFYYRSINYSLNLKIPPNGFSGSRFLAFAICLVADLTYVKRDPEFICKYQLTAASGEKFTSECHVFERWHGMKSYDACPEWYGEICSCRGDHVFILFNQDMIILDNNYEEASFEFDMYKRYKVKECGVDIFYMDAGNYTMMRQDKSNQNSGSQEDANIEGANEGSATEIRSGNERRFGSDGEIGGVCFQGHHLTDSIVMEDLLAFVIPVMLPLSHDGTSYMFQVPETSSERGRTGDVPRWRVQLAKLGDGSTQF